MTFVASTLSRPQRTARSSGLLVLEPPRHTQLPLAFLRPGKHLIGTSDACAIRVLAEGVQPRHAMLLVGDQMTLLKALDSRTWVNDGVVSETTLRPGDRISIGPITYKLRIATADELLEFNSPEIETPVPVVPPEPVRAALPPQLSPQLPPPIPPELLAESMRVVEVLSVVRPPASPAVSIQNLVESISPIDFDHGQNVVGSIAAAQPIIPETVEHESVLAGDAETTTSRVEAEPPVESPGPALREIHRQIALLNDLPMVVDHGRDHARLEEERQRLSVKETELAQVAEELSRQAQRLRDRHAQLSERESAHERKQLLLTQEQERLVAAAQTTRRDLADEHGRQKSLWQEWDAAYRRSAEELKEQLEFVEQRRSAFQLEAERITESRFELQRLREDFERDRRVAAAERVQATQELGELHSSRAAFETERRQHLVEIQERETQLANERHALAMLQDELLSSRQRMEHDRTTFAAERSAESRQREQEVREHTQARMRLNDEETALHSIRVELESDRQSFTQEREALRRERERFDAARSDVDCLRTELSQVKCELDLHRQAIDDHLRANLKAEEQVGQLQAEIECVRRSKQDLESKLETERRELQRERNAYDFERVDVEELQAELERSRRRRHILETELESERRDLQRERNAYDFERVDVDGLLAELESLRKRKLALESELEAERHDIQRERNVYDAERTELSQLQADLELARAASLDNSRDFEQDVQANQAADSEVRRLLAEVEELRQSDQDLRGLLDAERHRHHLERESFAATREEMNAALTAARSERDRFVEQSSIDCSTSGSPDYGHWHHESTSPSIPKGVTVLGSESPYESLAGSIPASPPQIPFDSQWPTGSVAWSGQSIGDKLTEEVVPGQQVASSYSQEVVIRQDSAADMSMPETHSTLESNDSSSVQTAVIEEGEAIAEELLPRQQKEDAVALRVMETIDSTLSGVSQFFESSASAHEVSPRETSSFDPTSSGSIDSEKFDNVESLHGIESAFRRGNSETEDLSLPNLRAQLAQMFDLPESPTSTREGASVDPLYSEAPQIDLNGLSEDLNRTTTASEVAQGVAGAFTTAADVTAGASLDSDEKSGPTIENSEEDNAWTRRLRELSQLVSPAPSAAVTPAPPVVAESAETSLASVEAVASEVDEYSVEAQLARLLGKPRLSPNTASGVAPSVAKPEEPKPFAVYVPPVDPVPEVDIEDRSHLLAEPRHRQNKNAIREEVQSFREVAQMSARTALAKHTWDNLRNEFYMTAALTSISAVATSWYVGSFLLGSETEYWKGVACALAALLSSQRLIRASKQLNQWRRKNLLRTSTKKAPAPPLSLVVDAAANDEDSKNPSKDVPGGK